MCSVSIDFSRQQVVWKDNDQSSDFSAISYCYPVIKQKHPYLVIYTFLTPMHFLLTQVPKHLEWSGI